MTATSPHFADTSVCPDCRSVLPATPFRCPTCGLPLQGFLADQLLSTLRDADDLLVRLRASAVAAPVASAVAAPVASAVAAPSTNVSPAPHLDPELPPMPAPAPTPRRRGLQGASVPKILLGLGALCLLVAAVIFLAVAWTWLGVGGRTAVLVAMTAVTGAGGWALGRRGLRVAAESLTAVALGLVALDVVGADNAGWFGALSSEELVRIVGVALLVPALGLCVPRTRLVVPQLVAPAGLALVLGSIDWSRYGIGAVDLGGIISVLALTGLVVLGRRLTAAVLAWTSGCLAALVWAGSGAWALLEADQHPTFSALWADGHGWELVAASLLALLVWGVGWSEPLLRQGAGALVVSALTWVAVLPGLDESATAVGVIAVGVVLAWTVAAALTPPGWYAVPRVPLAVGALAAAATSLYLLAASGAALLVGDPFSVRADIRLVPVDVEPHPLLLVSSVAALAVAAVFALPRVRATLPSAGAAIALAALSTLGLYAVPLWVPVAAIAVVGAGLLVVALRRADSVAVLAASAAAASGVVLVIVAVPSAVLATVSLSLVVLALGATLVQGRFPGAAEASGLGLPLAVGGLMWAIAETGGIDRPLRAVPILLVVGLLALARPRPEVESSAAFAGLLACLGAVPLADDVSVSLAVHLTVAGALVTTTAIVHPARRFLAWPGGLLLAMATWVRLADLGVEAPEAYTLPTAAALVLVGLDRLRRADESATVPALGPGLALATIPSLLWVLYDPLSIRALALGVGCLALLLLGARLRWHAPVVTGAVVGGLVVLRELAPYAMQTPQWVVIGLAGAVLITCGVTWESRMRDLQHATAYLGRLR